MPLTEKGRKIKRKMEEHYGKKKGENVFYASQNKGTIKGTHKSSAFELGKRAASEFLPPSDVPGWAFRHALPAGAIVGGGVGAAGGLLHLALQEKKKRDYLRSLLAPTLAGAAVGGLGLGAVRHWGAKDIMRNEGATLPVLASQSGIFGGPEYTAAPESIDPAVERAVNTAKQIFKAWESKGSAYVPQLAQWAVNPPKTGAGSWLFKPLPNPISRAIGLQPRPASPDPLSFVRKGLVGMPVEARQPILSNIGGAEALRTPAMANAPKATGPAALASKLVPGVPNVAGRTAESFNKGMEAGRAAKAIRTGATGSVQPGSARGEAI